MEQDFIFFEKESAMTLDIQKIIEQQKVIAICRKVYGAELSAFVSAIERGGIQLVEVTFDQQDPLCIQKTSEALRMLNEAFPGRAFGAGTVLTRDQVKAAHDAGAKYIISPNTDTDVIHYTKELGLVSIPGAMTPSEIITAHHAGADFVKLFPCGSLGAAYIKEVMSPINHIKMMAVGGINIENLAAFMSLGFVGVGIGSSLCSKKLLSENRFDQIEENARKIREILSNR